MNNHAISNDSTFGTNGGAILISLEQTSANRIINIQNCDFQNNSSVEEGGAVVIFDISAFTQTNEITIDNCLFKENNAVGVGAVVIGLMSNEINIKNSIFQANYGSTALAVGGGNSALSSSYYLNLTNCLFTEHDSEGNQFLPILGFDSFRTTINNCTIAGNQSSGIGVLGLSDHRIQNSIFNTPGYPSAGSFSINSETFYTSLGGNLFSDNAAADFALDIDLQSADPLFEAGTFQLSEDSPCVDTGVLPQNVSDFDLAGNDRVQGGCIDMGAYESVHDAGLACVTDTREVLVDASIINLYPNPVSDNITIELENEWKGDLQIRVINMLGQVKADFKSSKTGTSFQLDWDAKQLPTGIYEILISNGEKMVATSFIKR